MKKVAIAIALSLATLGTFPTVGNAAGMIEANCKEGEENFPPLSFIPTNGKQKIVFGFVNVSFDEKDQIIFQVEKTREVFSINTRTKTISDLGKNDSIKEAIIKNRSEAFGTCTFKNLSLLPKTEKPVSTSVQQRLQALEERLDRIESLLQK